MEVLNGRYELKINKNIPFKKKIGLFSYEPMAYYLYKKRDFVHRLEKMELSKEEKEEKEFYDLIQKLTEDSSEITNKKFLEYIKKIRKAI